MAKSVVIIDDLDGSQGAETVEFSFRGERYEIDLGSKNQQRLDEALAEFVGHARKLGGSRAAGAPRRSAGQPAKRDAAQLQAMREWGRQNGWPDLSDRGRVPAEVEAAYNAAK